MNFTQSNLDELFSEEFLNRIPGIDVEDHAIAERRRRWCSEVLRHLGYAPSPLTLVRCQRLVTVGWGETTHEYLDGAVVEIRVDQLDWSGAATGRWPAPHYTVVSPHRDATMLPPGVRPACGRYLVLPRDGD